jgi:hypothetical protein
MKERRDHQTLRYLAWVAGAVVLLAILLVAGLFVRDFGSVDINWQDTGIWVLLPIVFAAAALVILVNQPRHAIGWLMMTLALGTSLGGLSDVIVAGMSGPSATLGVGQWLALGMNNFGWVFLIFPILHMLLVFPTGRLLSPRWRPFAALEVVMVSVMLIGVMFGEEIGPIDAEWTVANPIGFIPQSFFGSVFGLLWSLGLVVMAIGGFASVIIRFTRSKGIERQQMKLLVYAFGIFATTYVISALLQGLQVYWLLDLLFIASLYLIPIAMTVAIVRHRLFDVDLIIRKTVLYVLLTGLLGLLYFGSVVAMQNLLTDVGNSSLIVAASTLLVAAVFAPLRTRLQRVIDRRLFRSRYDMERVIEDFSAKARDQSEMAELSTILVAAVDQTMQPSSTGLWIKEPVSA